MRTLIPTRLSGNELTFQTDERPANWIKRTLRHGARRTLAGDPIQACKLLQSTPARVLQTQEGLAEWHSSPGHAGRSEAAATASGRVSAPPAAQLIFRRILRLGGG